MCVLSIFCIFILWLCVCKVCFCTLGRERKCLQLSIIHSILIWPWKSKSQFCPESAKVALYNPSSPPLKSWKNAWQRGKTGSMIFMNQVSLKILHGALRIFLCANTANSKWILGLLEFYCKSACACVVVCRECVFVCICSVSWNT